MDAGRSLTGTRGWLFAGVVSAGVIALLVALFRSPAVPVPPAATRAIPSVGVARIDAPGNTLLKEEALLRDPTPLFLPTRWSASEKVEAENVKQGAGSSFVDYPAKLTFAQAELHLHLPPPVAVPARPADAFATDKPARPFFGFGEKDLPVAPLAARGAFLKVVAEADGRVALAEPLVAAKPPTTVAWAPMEFLVAIDPAGMVSPPMLTESSQVAAVDDYFQGFLTEKLHIGDRLAPGFYRVSIGP